MRLIDGHDTYASHLNSIPLGLEYMHSIRIQKPWAR